MFTHAHPLFPFTLVHPPRLCGHRPHQCPLRCWAIAGDPANLEVTSGQRGLVAHERYEEQLQSLSQLEPASLAEVLGSRPDTLSLDFLLWLADKEAAAEGEYKRQLAALCQQLVSMREGFEQASASQQQLQAHAQQADGLDSASLLQLGARWRVLTAEGACAQSALSPEAALLAERQVSQLGAGVRQARAQSSVELLGRKTLDSAGDQEAAERLLVSPADPAARILEALLYEADQAARFAMLPDVFTPPDPQQQDAVDEEIEQLYTTPARLVQAIDLATRQLGAAKQSTPAQAMLPSASRTPADTDVIGALQALRSQVLRLWLDSDDSMQS